MAQSSSIFITASDARQNPIRETVVHDEARAIETAVLEAVKLGLFDCVVRDGTPMTMSTFKSSDVWTIDPTTSVLYVPNHGLKNGDAVNVWSNGTLPSPLVATKYYYAIYVDENHVKLASSYADAVAGRPISIEITSGVSSVTVTENGSGYLQAPAVTFTGGNPTKPATATAYLSDWGSVVAINNTTSGAGYTDVPSVQIVSQGSGASSGTVTYTCVTATVSSTGQDYRVGDILSVIGGIGTATTIRVTDVDNNGSVLSVSVANGGNYSSLPSVSGVSTTVAPGGGQGCTVNLSFGVATVAVSSVGTGYIAAPKVTINSTTGTGASAYATLYGGSVNQVVVTDPGYGYLDVSSIDFDTGSGASASVMLQPTTVGNISLTDNGGITYSSTPTVTIEPRGSGAAAGTVVMKVVNAVLVGGGTNYQVGDSLLVSGGVALDNAWIRVQSVDSFGAIKTYRLENGGLYTAMPGINLNPVSGGSGTLASFNLSMGVESIAVSTGGSGYIVPPVVTIDAPGGSGMTALARGVLNSGSVTSFVVEKSGYGYSDVPAISISNGVNAAASAYLTPTTVNNINIINPGNDYTTATVTISGGGAVVDALAIANIVNGQIDSIDIIHSGSGYTGTPTVTITGDGTGAEASVSLNLTSIAYISVTNAGTGYNVPPLVTITGAATAVALLTGTGVANIIVDSIGQNYVGDPIIYLTPSVYQTTTPLSPVMVPARAFGVSRIALTSSGTGYQSAPTIGMSAPFFSVGTQATATSTIGAGTGTFMLTAYPSSKDYYAAWKGQALSNNQLSRPYAERMDTIISYFTNLGYTINRLTNPETNTTLMWSLQW